MVPWGPTAGRSKGWHGTSIGLAARPALYELDDDPKRKEFLDDLFGFMQKRGLWKGPRTAVVLGADVLRAVVYVGPTQSICCSRFGWAASLVAAFGRLYTLRVVHVDVVKNHGKSPLV
ncbi:hypothetical protein Y1Q_0009469 [Alligator mississippiensis]|uniref:Uncharacterized protein n=1 Tax=Alligator mississippiensis TaxID=8496 RepID=A0A151NZ31_ALLMI|nr:hypothetical protein Y1Q_0009469 [Alligator mississippiensis]